MVVPPPLAGIVNPWAIVYNFVSHSHLKRPPSPREFLTLLRCLAGLTDRDRTIRVEAALDYCRNQALFTPTPVVTTPEVVQQLIHHDPGWSAESLLASVWGGNQRWERSMLGGGRESKVATHVAKALTGQQHWQRELLLADPLAAHLSALRAFEFGRQLKVDVGLRGDALVAQLAYTEKTANYILGSALQRCDLPLAFNFLWDILDKESPPSESALRFLFQTVRNHEQFRQQLYIPNDPHTTDQLRDHPQSQPLPHHPESADGDSVNIHHPASLDETPFLDRPTEGGLPVYLLRRSYFLFEYLMTPPSLPRKSSVSSLADPWPRGNSPTATQSIPASSIEVLKPLNVGPLFTTNPAAHSTAGLADLNDDQLFQTLFTPPPVTPTANSGSLISHLIIESTIDRIIGNLEPLILYRPFYLPPAILTSAFKTLIQDGRIAVANGLFQSILGQIFDPSKAVLHQRPGLDAAASYTPSYLRFYHKYPWFSPPLNRLTFNTLIQGWFHARRPRLARWCLDLMVRCGIQPGVDTWNIFLLGFFSIEVASDAEAAWKLMRGVSWSPKSRRRREPLLPALSSHKAFQSSHPDLGNLSALGSLPAPDDGTYQVLLNGFGKARNIDMMLDVYNHLLANSAVIPTRQHYSTLLIHLNRSCDYEEAVQRLCGMVDGFRVDRLEKPRFPSMNPEPMSATTVDGQTPPTRPLFFPTTAVFNDLIRRLGEANQPDLALQVFEALNEAAQREPDESHHLIRTTVDLRDPPSTTSASISTTTSPTSPLPPSTSPSSSSLSGHPRQSMAGNSQSLYTPRFSNIITYNLLIRQFLARSDYPRAHRVFALIKCGVFPPNVDTYVLLIDDALRRGTLRKALMLFGEMTHRYHWQPTAALFNHFIDFYLQRARVAAAAAATTASSTSPHHDPPTQEADVDAHGSATEATRPIPRGGRPFRAALGTYRRFAAFHIPPTNRTFHLLLDGCVEHQAWDTARQLLADLEDDERFVSSQLVERIFAGFLAAQRPWDALAVYEKFEKLAMRPPPADLASVAGNIRLSLGIQTPTTTLASAHNTGGAVSSSVPDDGAM
ncbi:hypothetical protein H4R33_002259 [Dimargaris cristalligena]|nr:hypothetical protein H4R33_002259 [Dimargaris cristalligena]